jgi:hypothetical protein
MVPAAVLVGREHSDLAGHGFAAALGEASLEDVERLSAELLASEINLVIHDSHAPWGRIAADFLGLVRITSHTMYPPTTAAPRLRRAGAANVSGLVPFGPADWIARAEAARLLIERRWGSGWAAGRIFCTAAPA